MAFALTNTKNEVFGEFVERDYGHVFEYTINTDGDPAYPHRIFVGPNGEETRMARVLKTVAYIVTDEKADEFGRTYFVEEKWQIKKHRNFKNYGGVL
jgi:hypothetical protein